MPVTVTSIAYNDEYNAGTTNAFQGNIGDKLDVQIDFFYENVVDASLSTSTSLLFTSATTANFPTYTGNAVIDLTPFGLSTEAFNELFGKEITISNTKAAYNGVRNVLEVNPSTREICLDVAYSAAGGNNFNNGDFYVSTLITALDLLFSYDSPSAANFTGSISNNLEQKFISPSSATLDHTNTTPVNMIFGTVGSYQTGSATIEGANLGVTGRQGFIFKQEFIIIPILPNSDLNNLGFSSFNPKYFIQPKEAFNSLPIQAGSNVTITNGRVTNIQDNGGFLDTNFGFVPSNYSPSNLSIVRTSDNESSGVPIVEEQFTVSFDIDNTTDNPFSNTNTQVQIAIENVPDTLTSSTQDYEDKFVYDRAITTLGAGAIAGESTGDAASITNYTAVFNSTSNITVSFDVDFTSNAETQIQANSGRRFIITCAVQDHTKTYVNSDRITLTVFDGQGIDRILQPPVNLQSTNFVIHTRTSIDQGVTSIDGFPVQDLVATSVFDIDWTNRTNLRLNSVVQSLVLKNSSTLEEINLNESTIPVSTFPLINNEYPDAGDLNQGTNYNVSKGFKIPSTEIRNNIIMSNINPNASPVSYKIAFPFFVRWEDYTQLILNTIPSSIIDTAEPFNGVNYFLHRYDTLANWDLFYRLRFESSEGSATFSQIFDEAITTTDYESHPDVTNRSLLSYKEDKVTPLLSGGVDYVESTEKTFIEAKWTFGTAPSSVNDFEIVFFMEGFEGGSPTSIQRISSINNILSSSWFTDTGANDGLVEKAISGNDAIGRVFIDNTKLQLLDKYRIYAQIYNPPTPADNLVSEAGDDLITESNDKFITE